MNNFKFYGCSGSVNFLMTINNYKIIKINLKKNLIDKNKI